MDHLHINYGWPYVLFGSILFYLKSYSLLLY